MPGRLRVTSQPDSLSPAFLWAADFKCYGRRGRSLDVVARHAAAPATLFTPAPGWEFGRLLLRAWGRCDSLESLFRSTPSSRRDAPRPRANSCRQPNERG